MLPSFDEMLDYNYQCNKNLIRVMQENTSLIPAKAIGISSHILNVHQTWNCKIIKTGAGFAAWETHHIEDFEFIDQKNHSRTVSILKRRDISEPVNYSTGKGASHVNTISAILFHIINHSSYHRGQIATEFRAADLDPLVSDYIFYKMKNNVLEYRKSI